MLRPHRRLLKRSGSKLGGKHLGEKVEKPYVVVRAGKKEVGETKTGKGPETEWNETFQMPTGQGECVLDIAVM